MIDLFRKTKKTGGSVDEENNAIYINYILTKFNRNVFFKTKTFTRESGYRYAWFKDKHNLFLINILVVYII